MPDPLLTYRGTVYPWHCDHMGHMNVMWYVGKFDEATWHFFNAIGLSPTYLNVPRNLVSLDQTSVPAASLIFNSSMELNRWVGPAAFKASGRV